MRNAIKKKVKRVFMKKIYFINGQVYYSGGNDSGYIECSGSLRGWQTGQSPGVSLLQGPCVTTQTI